MALFKRKTERMAQIANPVIKQVYENQGHMYENIMIPITDGKRMYNISVNLRSIRNRIKGHRKSIRKGYPAAYHRRCMERKPARTGRTEALCTECQLRTERSAVDLQAGISYSV